MKKTLAIIFAILMVATLIPFVFAAENDGDRTVIDVANGKVVLSDKGVTQNGEAITEDPDGYILTGTKDSVDGIIVFENKSDKKHTFDVTLKDLNLTAKNWSSVINISNDGSPMVINVDVEGSNIIKPYNHPMFSSRYNGIDIEVNLNIVEDAILNISRADNGREIYFSNMDYIFYLNGNPIGYDGHIHEKYDDEQKNCYGYKCKLCNGYFGGRIESLHVGDGIQTCNGYKCSECYRWYGEKGEHLKDVPTCKGYYCWGCDSYYGETDPTKHEWYYGWCSWCGVEFPEDQVCQHNWTRYGSCTVCGERCSHETITDGHCTVCSYISSFKLISGETASYYSDFESAYDAAKDGDKIVLMCDKMDELYMSLDKKITIDLNGHEWEQPSLGSFSVYDGVTFDDSVGGGRCSYGLYVLGKCTINGGQYRYVTISDKTDLTLSDILGKCRAYFDWEGNEFDGSELKESGEDVTVKHSSANIVKGEAKAPTCTEAGCGEYEYCTACTYTTYKEIPATNHKDTIVKKDGKAASCTKSGYEAYEYCTACTYTTYKEIPAKGHSNKTVTTKATLSKNGKTETKCSVCGVVSKTTTIYIPKTMTLSATSYTYNGKVKTPSVTVKDSKGNTLKKDTDYTVKYESGRKTPGKYTVQITFKGKYSGTKKLYFTIAAKATTKIATSQSTSAIKLSWAKVTGATGYRIYYKSGSNWKTAVSSTKATSYTFKNLKAGKKYQFKVRAYTKDGDTIWGAYSAVFETATKPATPTLKVTSTSKNKATLTWKNVEGESGYQIYYSTKKDSGYKLLATAKPSVSKATITKLTSGKTYYFRVRAYIETANGTIYGGYKTVAVKAK